MNDLRAGITSMCRIFADNLLFSKVLGINESVTGLNFASEKISQWVYQRKMQFNPDLKKQTT